MNSLVHQAFPLYKYLTENNCGYIVKKLHSLFSKRGKYITI